MYRLLAIDRYQAAASRTHHDSTVTTTERHHGNRRLFADRRDQSATSSTAGGHTAERVEFTEIGVNKTADLASPILAQHCAMGKTIPKAKLEFMRADGDGKRVKYYEVELENVLISKCQQGVAAGDVMQEHIGLKFSKVKWKYCQQRIAGGAGGNTAGGWDLAANRVAA